MGSPSNITGHWTRLGSSYRLAQIQHRLVQYPVILDGYPSNKICVFEHYAFMAVNIWSSDGDQRDKERRRRRHGSPSDEEDPHKSHKRRDYESSRRGDKVSAVCFLVLCLGAVTL